MIKERKLSFSLNQRCAVCSMKFIQVLIAFHYSLHVGNDENPVRS